jgi:hypothetical protein
VSNNLIYVHESGNDRGGSGDDTRCLSRPKIATPTCVQRTNEPQTDEPEAIEPKSDMLHPDASEANDPDVNEADIYHPGESKGYMCYADAAGKSETTNCHADTRHSRQIQSRRPVFERTSERWLWEVVLGIF